MNIITNMEFIKDLYPTTIGMFPDLLKLDFWVAWLFGLLCSVVLSLPRWKWVESIERNKGTKLITIAMLSFAIVLLMCGISWEVFLLLFLPLLYYSCRMLCFWQKCRKVRMITDKKARLIEQYDLLEYLKKKDLMRWEIKKFYLPLLKTLYDIGAFNRLDDELEELRDDYKDCFQWTQLKSFVLFNKHRYQEMIDLLREEEKDVKVSDKERYTVVNNLYCAFRNMGDKAGLETCKNKLEKIVFEEKCYMLEALDNLLYYYEQNHDVEGQKKVCDIAEEKMNESLDNFFNYGDIIYMHNKRLMKTEDNRKLLDELNRKVEESDFDEERKLNIGLKLMRLAFENDYKWMDLSLRVFRMAESYLEYSRDTALVFMEEVYLIIKNAQEQKGISMPDMQIIRLFKIISEGIGKYMSDIDNELTEMSDDFLYVKKSLLMNKVTYERIKVTIDGNISEYLRNVVDLEKRIIKLCERNREEREKLHFMVVLTDDIIDYIKKTDLEAKSSYLDDIRNYTEQIGYILKSYDYEPSLAYYIFYYAYFQKYLGNMGTARYALDKFRRTGVDIKNFSVVIQRLYVEVSES